MKKIYGIVSLLIMSLLLVSCDFILKPDENDNDDKNELTELNTLYIQINNGEDIKRDKWERATLTIGDLESPKFESDALRVRGRGNSTWYSVPPGFEKRPYRIRFDEDTSILGYKQARDYVLLAEHFDRSLLRNYFSHRMSEDLDIGYKNVLSPIELYVNGEYQGFYILCEQIELHDYKLKIDTSGAQGGFLIELEADDRIGGEGIENINWVRVRDRNYVIKGPDMDDLTESEARAKTTYIKNYLDLVYTSLPTSNYEDYVDIEKFIDYFVLNEIAKQIDINWSSVFAYKDANGKLTMGPIWDFDLGYGNTNYGEKDGILFESSSGFWMNGNQWFDQAVKNQAFRFRYVERFKEVLNTYFDEWLVDLEHMYKSINDAANRNFDRWEILDLDMWPITQSALALNSHQEHYESLRNYLIERKAWLLDNIDIYKY